MPTPRRRKPARRRRRAALRTGASVIALVVLAGLLTACRTSGLVFRKTDLRIESPDAASAVTLPLTIRWNPGGALKEGHTFAVFLDRPTIKSGASVMDVIPDSCLKLPSCDRADYLEQEKVWITASPSLVLTTLPRTADHSSGKEFHTVTVIVLDAAQKRATEEFSSIDFVYRRP